MFSPACTAVDAGQCALPTTPVTCLLDRCMYLSCVGYNIPTWVSYERRSPAVFFGDRIATVYRRSEMFLLSGCCCGLFWRRRVHHIALPRQHQAVLYAAHAHTEFLLRDQGCRRIGSAPHRPFPVPVRAWQTGESSLVEDSTNRGERVNVRGDERPGT